MYRGDRYWERETPEEARARKVWLAYFPRAGKLQIATVWRGEDGEVRRGKTVTLDAEDLGLHDEARGLLRRFLEAAETPF